MFEIYIYKAIKKQHLDNQNQLCKLINISSAAMADLKTGKKLPSEKTMLKVAALAGVPAEKALIDLNLWRAKDDATRLEVWKRISKMIVNSAPIILILSVLSPALSILSLLHNVYYVYLNKKNRLFFNRLTALNIC